MGTSFSIPILKPSLRKKNKNNFFFTIQIWEIVCLYYKSNKNGKDF